MPKTGWPGVKFGGLHWVAEYLEEEEGVRIDEIPIPSLSVIAPAVSLNTYQSFRRTKVAMIYKRTGNIRAVQILLGHSKVDSTVRYLGVALKDALALSEATDI